MACFQCSGEWASNDRKFAQLAAQQGLSAVMATVSRAMKEGLALPTVERGLRRLSPLSTNSHIMKLQACKPSLGPITQA
eukprot:1157891-Pelagomonas_calceolata.AAC.14